MIISHKYKYLFIELPRTGSTAISAELIKYYGGKSILKKHSQFSSFLKIATKEEKKYFVFSCIRNPLDRTVSLYFHLDKTLESLNRRIKEESRLIKKLFYRISYYHFKRRNTYINRYNADFSKYFLKFYKTPYIDWSIIDHQSFDFIIRFENLQDDFNLFLKTRRITQIRKLPIINKTANRQKNFQHYFNDNAKQRAKKIFLPFIKKTNYMYNIPEEWGVYKPSNIEMLKFKIVTVIMKILWYFTN